MRTSFHLNTASIGGLALAVLLSTASEAQVRAPTGARARVGEPVSAPCFSTLSTCYFHHSGFESVAGQVTPVAGHTADAVHRLPFETQGASAGYVVWGNNIHRVTIRERGDEPCLIAVEGSEGAAQWSACGGAPRSTRSAGIDGPWSLVGIRTCGNDRNGARGRLVKGIELEWVRRPHETTRANRIVTTEAAVQPNCSQWLPWVRCPTGMAAQTLLVHHEAIGGRRGAVGLQLECYPVRPVCFDESDSGWGASSLPPIACHAGDD